MKKNTNKKGFTIVELVIVIAVIAILSAVLIPTFGSVIADANNAAAVQKARNAQTTFLSDKDNLTNLTDESVIIVYDSESGNYFGENDKGEFANLGNTLTYSANNIVITMAGENHTCGATASAACDVCNKPATGNADTNTDTNTDGTN